VTDNAHAAALLALLAAVSSPDLTVYDGAVAKPVPPALPPEPPYVVVYFADADPSGTDAPSLHLTGQPRRHVTDAYVHSVGANGEAARIVAARVRTALLGVRPTITGRTCYPIRRQDGQPSTRDESTGRLVIDKIDVYRLSSIPA
jgi:hypothetical protein